MCLKPSVRRLRRTVFFARNHQFRAGRGGTNARRRQARSVRGADRQCRRLGLGAFPPVARRRTRRRRCGAARQLVETGHPPGGCGSRRLGVFSVRSPLAALPAMGNACRRAEAVAARHPHSSALRSMARLSRRACVRSSHAGDGRAGGWPPLRNLCWKALPFHLPGGCFGRRYIRYRRCRAHLRTGEGVAGCLAHGCLSRDACPVGRDYRYPVGQLRFHMAAIEF